MEGDARSFRVALVADEYVNPGGDGVDGLAVLERAGWGVMQLPAAWYADEVAGPLLEQIAEQVEEFARHGYDLVLVGGRQGLDGALAAMGLPLPAAVVPQSEAELSAFLETRPAPGS